MKQILRRYLTKNPKLEQNKSLKMIGHCIGDYPKRDIELALNVWHEENKQRLNEKNENSNYKHVRTRKAYKSMKSKLYRCYTFQRHRELGIPRTNNSLE